MKLRRRTRASGAVVWFADYRADGVRFQKVIPGIKVEPRADLQPGTRAWDRAVREAEAVARDVAERFFVDIKRKGFLGELAGPTLAGRTATLEDALTRDRARPGVSDATRVIEAEQAKALVECFGATRLVATIGDADVEHFKKWRKGSGETERSNRTVNMGLQVLKAFLGRCRNRGEIVRVPKFKKLPEDSARRRFLTRDECARLLAAIPAGRFRDIVVVFLNLGLRRSELYRLTWRDVDLVAGTVSVEARKKGASGSARRDVLPLNAAALEVFRRMAPDAGTGDGLVFGILPSQRDAAMNFKKKPARPGHDRGIVNLSDHNLSRSLKAAAERAGIERPREVTIHGLRHTFATNLLGNGANVKDVQALLRHSSPLLTLKTYCHEQLGSMRSAVDGLGFDEAANVVAVGEKSPEVLPVGERAPKRRRKA